MLARILVVEDDPDVRLLLRVLLEEEGYQVVEAAAGDEAAELGVAEPFDLVLLDLRLPKLSGFEVCRAIRQRRDTPIIMVTAQADSHDVVAGLEAGADDYVTKPFVERELLARIRAQLRRTQGLLREQSILRAGDCEIRTEEAMVLVAGVPVHLTRTEYHLLLYLMTNPNRVFSREQLLQKVWEYEYAGDGRLVDAHIRRLRIKIEADPSQPVVLQTVRGLGYKLVP